MNPRHLQTKALQRAFTLVELLVVLSIVGIIVAFTVPAMNSVMGGSQITQAGQMVGDQLALARQTALSKNHTVEVRFYRFGDPDMPGEKATDPSTGRYRTFQPFEIFDTGAAVALAKIQRIPSSIIIDSGTTLSSLLNTGTTSNPQVSLPRVGTNYNYFSFRFLPDGSTNLSPTSQWFLTVHNGNDGDALTAPPKNFYTIQIDATNGHIKSYRP